MELWEQLTERVWTGKCWYWKGSFGGIAALTGSKILLTKEQVHSRNTLPTRSTNSWNEGRWIVWRLPLASEQDWSSSHTALLLARNCYHSCSWSRITDGPSLKTGNPIWSSVVLPIMAHFSEVQNGAELPLVGKSGSSSLTALSNCSCYRLFEDISKLRSQAKLSSRFMSGESRLHYPIAKHPCPYEHHLLMEIQLWKWLRENRWS